MRKNNRQLITAHCLVRNEEKWIWYAINSVIDYVDKILVFDTGSTDKTVEIIKSIKNPKIIFEEKGLVDKRGFTKLRQEMLDRTESEWFLILDGDEIWPEAGIRELRNVINSAGEEKQAIIAGEWVCIGDIFHYSEKLENFVMGRALRKIPGLHCTGEYGYESYADKDNLDASRWDRERLIFIKNKFFHMSFLQRSNNIRSDREVMMRAPKRFFHKGKAFPEGFKYPEIFYIARPANVAPPWKRLTWRGQAEGIYYRFLNFFERFKRVK